MQAVHISWELNPDNKVEVCHMKGCDILEKIDIIFILNLLVIFLEMFQFSKEDM